MPFGIRHRKEQSIKRRRNLRALVSALFVLALLFAVMPLRALAVGESEGAVTPSPSAEPTPTPAATEEVTQAGAEETSTGSDEAAPTPTASGEQMPESTEETSAEKTEEPLPTPTETLFPPSTGRHFSVKGTLILRDITLSDNYTSSGGIEVVDGGNFTMDAGAEIRNCRGNSGGGVAALGNGQIEIKGGTINDNYANYGAGLALIKYISGEDVERYF